MLMSVHSTRFKAFCGALRHIGGKHSVFYVRANFANKEHASQLNGPLTEEGPRGMTKKRNFYAFDMVFLSVALLIDSSLGCVKTCDLAWISAFCTKMVPKDLI